MKQIGKVVGGLAILAGCISASVSAQVPDFSGTWTGKAKCPVGPVEFTVELKGSTGTLTYDGYGPQKLYATEFPVKLTYSPSLLSMHFAGPRQGENFGSFQGKLLADGTVDQVLGLKVNGGFCDQFALSRSQVGKSRVSERAPAFDARGLVNESLFMNLLEGHFSRIHVPADHPVFNSLYGSYLGAYARKCAANPQTRPKKFVEMTDLQCGDERVTATYYSNGMYTESAPYCNRWDEVPNGLYADPKMWDAKKRLDAVFHGDAYKNIFAFLKPGKTDILDRVYEISPQRMLAAATTGMKDMDALVGKNACDSPGLMRFQENLRLYAINRPFGIRANGSAGAPIPIPTPGTTFEDPNYESLLEDLVKEQARSWTTNKYLLKSIANPSVASRDGQGRPLSVKAGYRYGGMAGMQTGSVRVTFFEGYPECVYFSDKPNSCRRPDKDVTSRYVHGGYSLRNAPSVTPEEQRISEEEAARQSEARARERRELRKTR